MMDEALLERLDAFIETSGITRNEFICVAVQRELKRQENERFEQEHRESFEREPQSLDEAWMPWHKG